MTDPDSYWLPTIDNSASCSANTMPNSMYPLPEAAQLPRTARFPSNGYLQYVRTGIIPDNDSLANYLAEKGVPFRLLNFNQASDSSQANPINGVSYPDWAMLDLFYVPSSLLSYGSPYEQFAGKQATIVANQASAGFGSNYDNPYGTRVTYTNTTVVNNMFQYGTYGGATSGRINPNGSVVYTTNMNQPTPGITRTVPLQALLHGLMVNQTHSGTTTTGNDFTVPNWSGGVAVNETAVAQDIANYLTTNNYGPNNGPAPLRIPAEICNIPTVAACVATNSSGTVINPTRNDLVRQIVGNLTTQSNTFSVWVAGQSIVKSKTNLASDATSGNYGIYEPGDQITGSVRYHFIVERDFDTGTDGVYGNNTSPGPDGVVGTLDDTADLTGLNPRSPDYFYRIIYAEEIR